MKYNINYIIFIKNKLIPKQSTILLGRWNIVYCPDKINKKVDLSNEDHCGACNNYKYNNYKEIDINKMIFYEPM
jgi:hypothetical protein